LHSPPLSGSAILSLAASSPHSYEGEQLRGRNPAALQPSRGPVLPRWSEDHRVSGEPPAGDREPEDWAASTTTLAGEESLGLTTLLGGRFLKAAIETAQPIHHRLALQQRRLQRVDRRIVPFHA
jgi:hypothetical protein